jgi:hypothetical protein
MDNSVEAKTTELHQTQKAIITDVQFFYRCVNTSPMRSSPDSVLFPL